MSENLLSNTMAQQQAKQLWWVMSLLEPSSVKPQGGPVHGASLQQHHTATKVKNLLSHDANT